MSTTSDALLAGSGVGLQRLSAGGRDIIVGWLERPEKRNALNTAALEGLKQLYRLAEDSESVAALVIAGRGSVFCAGGDLSELVPGDTAGARRRAELMVEVFTYPQRLPVPVITAVRGGAVGAGAALCLSADIVIGSRDFFLELPELPKGISPSLVMSPVARHLGARVALDMVLTGRRVGADEALRIGGISRIVEGSPVDEALRVGADIAEADATLTAETKSLFYQQADFDLGASYRLGLPQE